MTAIPTFDQLYQSVKADLEAKFGSSIPDFGKNALRVFAVVIAAVLKLFYLAVGKVQKNIFPDTADSEENGGTLERFGRVKLNRNRFPAQAAQYSCTVTGVIGSIIPASTTFKTNDDSLNPGKLFILDSAYTLIAATDTITLRALEAGVESKLMIGDQLTSTSPIAGVNRIAVVASVVVDPRAAESIEDYRSKILQAFRLEPNGGSPSDYRLWSYDAQGVKQVYPYAATNLPGEMNLYVEATPTDSIDGVGTPSAQLLLDVADVVEQDPDTSKPLNERGRRPIGIFQVHVLPVTVKSVDINISGTVGFTADIKAKVFTALKAQIDMVRPFVAGADVLENKNDIFDVNRIAATVFDVKPGAQFGAITLTIDGDIVTSKVFLNGDIPFLNSVTYV